MKFPSLCNAIPCAIFYMAGGLLFPSCSLFDTEETVSFDSRPYKTIALSTEPNYIEATSAKALRNKGYKVLREWSDKDKPNAYLKLTTEKVRPCEDTGGRNRHYSCVEAQLYSSNGTIVWKGQGECVAEDFESRGTKSSLRSAAVRTISALPDYGDYPGMPPRKND